ncbi:hypothetical protein P167DRAFT_210798 [Morchella conica CCBAS932]|uniref:Uncharacterized protein n=1 Tax=Morchella conica CCBAS932 TaxID=1392247 RepID=A0A3N4KQP1_9PEZI|nr:hypothetical protein P167DRAFT_210798 [Morchella conica CCBAS932]
MAKTFSSSLFPWGTASFSGPYGSSWPSPCWAETSLLLLCGLLFLYEAFTTTTQARTYQPRPHPHTPALCHYQIFACFPMFACFCPVFFFSFFLLGGGFLSHQPCKRSAVGSIP